MSRRGVLPGVIGVVVAVTICMVGASAAWANTLTATCTSAGQTNSCNQSGSWYTSAVTLTWQVDPAPTKVAGCDSKPFGDTSTTVSCQVWWGVGGTPPSQLISFPLNVEASTPTAGAFVSRPPDSNGWYNHSLAVSFGGSAFSGIASCTPPVSYAGPDRSSVPISGSCRDNAGKVVSAGLVLSYDATPPSVTAAPARRPDHHGWYNHPVAFTFSDTDATSGISGCPTLTYAGPNSASASVTGSCADRAGNVATLAVPFRYDSAPPSVRASANTGDRFVSLRWLTGGDVAPITSLKIVRTPGFHRSHSVVYRGHGHRFRDERVTNGRRYTYAITAVDAAGNVTERTVHATPGLRILSPADGARLVAPPLLAWTPKRNADYYNVQLYRGKTKVLSIWPKDASVQLNRTWRFARHRHRFKPGIYRWYVWPGFGPRTNNNYGRLIGTGKFVIVRAA